MRFGSAAFKGALSGGLNKRYVADVLFNGTRVMQDVPIINPQFTDSGSSQVQFTGSCTIAYKGDFGESVAPALVGDMLAPFGARVAVSVLTTVGPLVERTPLGTYLITDDPKIVTKRRKFGGTIVADGDQIELTLQDLFAGVQRDRFDAPGTALNLSSVWNEYQRLTGFPVTKTITDAAIPTSVAYQEDKLQACYDLATVLDAVAYVTPDGTGSMRPVAWPAAVDNIVSADIDRNAATLVDVVPSLSNSDVYNAVVVRGTDPSGQTIVLARAEVTDGPLRVRNTDGSLSPYRRVPYYFASQYITTQAQAQAYADKTLPRVSQLRSLTYVLEETFNPLREVGDVVNVYRLGDQFTCRITDIGRDDGPTQQLTVTVDRTLVTPPYTVSDVPPVVPGLYPSDSLFPSDTLFPS